MTASTDRKARPLVRWAEERPRFPDRIVAESMARVIDGGEACTPPTGLFGKLT